MNRKGKEMERMARSILEEDLGMKVIGSGVRGNGHPYLLAELDGRVYSFSFSGTPGKFGRAGLKADFRRRLASWTGSDE